MAMSDHVETEQLDKGGQKADRHLNDDAFAHPLVLGAFL
jgi:hypothetical protein